MTWRINVAACFDDAERTNPLYLLRNDPKILVMLGDNLYSDMSTARTLLGTEYLPDIFWREGAANPPANARSVAQLKARAELWIGPNSMPEWVRFHQAVTASGVTVYRRGDDHDFAWNQCDHTTASLSNGFPDSFVGAYKNDGLNPFGQVVTGAQMTQADVLYVWRMRQIAWKWFTDNYSNNPAGLWGVNGDIPSAMVGLANAADYRIDYWYEDRGPDGELGGNTVRLLFPDCITYKSPNAATDDASKTLWGNTQTAYMQQALLSSKARGIGMNIIFSQKAVFGSDNGDGMGNYTTWRNTQLFQFIEDNDIPVKIMCGDKHLPHTSLARKAHGGITDLLSYCICPFGSQHSPLDQHTELTWAAQSDARPAWGTIEIDAAAGEVRVSMMDGYDTNLVMAHDRVRFGTRLPYHTYRRPVHRPTQRLGYGKASITVGGSPYVYQNATGAAGSVVIAGGTVSDVSVAQADGSYIALGLQRQVRLQHGDQVRVTYSEAPTMTWWPDAPT